MPGLVEANDQGMYVVKFTGAGQGPRVLIAELICASLARKLGLKVPELVFIELEAALGRAEPDSEIRQLLKASVGKNLGVDYLPGSVTYDPVAGPFPEAELASLIVLFDAYLLNVDRTAKNPNMLSWHKALWLIDHGAALYFHHGWTEADRTASSDSAFRPISQHVLLPLADSLDSAAEKISKAFTDEAFREAVAEIPAEWVTPDAGFADLQACRDAYATWLAARRAAVPTFLEEAKRARAQLV